MPISSAAHAHALPLSPPEHQHPHCLHLLQAAGGTTAADSSSSRRLTRLLVNVTVDRSLWPVHVVLGADATVADLIRAAVAAYGREGRRPPLPHREHDDGDLAASFELHLSKYSLQSLRPEEKVMDLGSRNFFLCARRPAAAPIECLV